jgi:hypothetical protein
MYSTYFHQLPAADVGCWAFFAALHAHAARKGEEEEEEGEELPEHF